MTEPEDAIVCRHPRTEDGGALWQIAHDSERLDANSAYYYLLFCKRYAPTSMVAEDRAAGRIVGFVTGLLWPDDPHTLFVWQVGVDRAARGRRVGSRMLDALLAGEAGRAATHLETTVTPSNEPSLALFRSLARRRGAECHESVFFPAEHFPSEAVHEPEMLLRIGPLVGAEGGGA